MQRYLLFRTYYWLCWLQMPSIPHWQHREDIILHFSCRCVLCDLVTPGTNKSFGKFHICHRHILDILRQDTKGSMSCRKLRYRLFRAEGPDIPWEQTQRGRAIFPSLARTSVILMSAPCPHRHIDLYPFSALCFLLPLHPGPFS